MRALLLTLLLAGLAGCASQPPRFETAGVSATLTPAQAASQEVAGRRVVWGGVVVNSSNLKDATQLEVLAYPLDEDQRPLTDRSPLGRFLALRAGYLETADYAPGRQVTVAGTLQAPTTGRIGQAEYRYPVLKADDLELWPRETRRSGSIQPSFGIGIGIGIH